MAHLNKWTKTQCPQVLYHDYHFIGRNSKNKNIDPQRRKLNYNLAPHDMWSYDYLKQRLSEIYCMNRKDVNVMCSWIFTVPYDVKQEDVDLCLKSAYDFLEDKYGKENVVSAFVHKDESKNGRPHIHFNFIPVVWDKKKDRYKVSARKTKAGIAKAIEIVDQVDDDALCALTVIYAVERWTAITGNISHGLKVMDELFSSLCYRTLPKGMDWAYHLDMLNAVRVSSVGTYKKFDDFYPNSFDGYSCVGIEKETETHKEAVRILEEANLPLNLLIEHELNSGYVRLCVSCKSRIEEIEITNLEGQDVVTTRNVTAGEIEALNKIWNLYSKESNKLI